MSIYIKKIMIPAIKTFPIISIKEDIILSPKGIVFKIVGEERERNKIYFITPQQAEEINRIADTCKTYEQVPDKVNEALRILYFYDSGKRT